MSRPASTSSQNKPFLSSSTVSAASSSSIVAPTVTVTDTSNGTTSNMNRILTNNTDVPSSSSSSLPPINPTLPLTSSKSSAVQVVCRVKPSPGYSPDQFLFDTQASTIDIHLNPKVSSGVVNNNVFSHSFALNAVLPDTISQQEVFDVCVRDIADSALDGISGCLLAYGQTGAGKTYTMSGPGTSYSNRGLIPRTISYICAAIESARQAMGEDKYILRISYVEIYNDKLIDLLAKSSLNTNNLEQSDTNASTTSIGNSNTTNSSSSPSYLQIQEDRKGRITVPGLVTPIVTNEADALRWLFAGEANRALAEHALNKASTRSHCIFTLYLEQQMSMDEATGVVTTNKTKNINDKLKKKLRKKKHYGGIGIVSKPFSSSSSSSLNDGNNGEDDTNEDNAELDNSTEINTVTVRSKIHLVDLAGSERLEKTASVGSIRKEAQAINKSLAFLEQVVVALLDKDRDHIPYRQSKLTHMLKDALGGHCRTRMIAAVWPDATHLEETVSTLRFATRMMRVRTTPVRDVSGNANGLSEAERERLVALYEGEITALRMELALHDTMVMYNSGSPMLPSHMQNIRYGPVSPGEMDSLRESVRSFIDGKADMVPASTVRQLQAALYIMRDIVRTTETLGKTVPPSTENSQNLSEHFRQRKPFPHSHHSPKGPVSPVRHVAKGGMNNDENMQPNDRSSSTVVDTYQNKANISEENTNNDSSSVTKVTNNDRLDDKNDSGDGTDVSPEAQAKYDDPQAKSEELEKWSTQGNGAGITVDYNTAKTNLKERKTVYNKVAVTVNESKQQIDSLLQILQTMDNNEYTGNQSKNDITEALTKAKAEYRTHFDNLREIRAEMDYLTKVIDSYKTRIGTEFAEHWANLCGVPRNMTNGNQRRTVKPSINNENTTFTFSTAKPLASTSSSFTNTTTVHPRIALPSSPPRMHQSSSFTATEYRLNDPQGGGGVGSPDGKKVYEEGIRKALYQNNTTGNNSRSLSSNTGKVRKK